MPRHLLVMGGVNDTNRGVPTATITGAMAEFEEDMVEHGIDFIWVTEPAWERAAEMDPINAWILTRPRSIDCRSAAGATQEGIHPVSYTALADCIDARLAAMTAP